MAWEEEAGVVLGTGDSHTGFELICLFSEKGAEWPARDARGGQDE